MKATALVKPAHLKGEIAPHIRLQDLRSSRCTVSQMKQVLNLRHLVRIYEDVFMQHKPKSILKTDVQAHPLWCQNFYSVYYQTYLAGALLAHHHKVPAESVAPVEGSRYVDACVVNCTLSRLNNRCLGDLMNDNLWYSFLGDQPEQRTVLDSIEKPDISCDRFLLRSVALMRVSFTLMGFKEDRLVDADGVSDHRHTSPKPVRTVDIVSLIIYAAQETAMPSDIQIMNVR